jgi:hypothetical protein
MIEYSSRNPLSIGKCLLKPFPFIILPRQSVLINHQSVLINHQSVFNIFLSNYWWQKSDIWSQASYRYAILWEAFLDPSDSYFLFADLVGFYTHWRNLMGPKTLPTIWHTYMKLVTKYQISAINSCWEKYLIQTDRGKTVYRPSESVFGPIRFLLPVCRLSWFLYTLNIYAGVS